MNLQFTAALFLVMSIIVSSSGCTGLQGLSAKQTWSTNYALVDGAESNDPAMIDGNVRTLGQSQYVESTGDTILGFQAQSEAIVMLPKPKSIHRVVIHSPNLLAFDIWTTDTQGRWEKIKEVESNKKKIVDIRLNRTMYTSGVKVRVRRVGNMQLWSGNVKAPAKIAEIELYGFVSEPDAAAAVTQPSAGNEVEELDEIDEFLK